MHYQRIASGRRPRPHEVGLPGRGGERERVIDPVEEAMPGRAYRFVIRPTDVAHGHPVLVFDRADRLHLPLTIFANVARARQRYRRWTKGLLIEHLLAVERALRRAGGSLAPRQRRAPRLAAPGRTSPGRL